MVAAADVTACHAYPEVAEARGHERPNGDHVVITVRASQGRPHACTAGQAHRLPAQITQQYLAHFTSAHGAGMSRCPGDAVPSTPAARGRAAAVMSRRASGRPYG